MKTIRNNKGLSLLITLIFLGLFSVIVVSYIATTATDSKVIKRSIYSHKAFFLAESGIHKALYTLQSNWAWPGEGTAGTPIDIDWPTGTNSTNGKYRVVIANISGHKEVTSTGYFLDPIRNVYVNCTIGVEITPPVDFFGNAVWAGGTVDISKRDQINGSVAAGNISAADAITYNVTKASFPILDSKTFSDLRNVSISQNRTYANGTVIANNLYTAANISSGKALPTSYWFNRPPGANYNVTTPGVVYSGVTYNTVPNVVYMEGNLTIHGNEDIYGFYVVGGNVSANTTVSGTSSIVGCIYTQGDFTINGGGNALNVAGGLWCLKNFDQGGNGKLDHNTTYMTAIQSLNIINASTKARIIEGSWEEQH